MLNVERSVAPMLKSAGFKKTARTWRRTNADSIQVVNIQKSPYGEQIYVNLGLYIRSLGPESSPTENRCHIHARLERVVPAEFHEHVAAADSIAPPSKKFVRALYAGLAWLDRISSPEGRKSFLATPMSRGCFVNSLARSA